MIVGQPDEDVFERELQILGKIKKLYIESLHYSLKKIIIEVQDLESICYLSEDNYRLFHREYSLLLQRKKKLEIELFKQQQQQQNTL